MAYQKFGLLSLLCLCQVAVSIPVVKRADHPYTETCSNAALSGAILSADCRKIDQSTIHTSIDLNAIIGNDNGAFRWGLVNFAATASNVQLSGTFLSATLLNGQGSPTAAQTDLSKIVFNNDGTLQAVQVPAVILIPDGGSQAVLDQLQQYVVNAAEIHIQTATDKDGTQTFYVNAGVDSSGYIFKTLTAEATASVLHIVKSTGKPIEQVSVDVLQAHASATLGDYIGGDAGVNLIHAKASIFDLNLGVGVSTGAGLRDDSIEAKIAGCGFTFGRKVGISVFDNSFSIDFGRLFG